MDLAALLSPVGAQSFLSDHFGRNPLHIPAVSAEPPLIGWERMNELLSIRSHWTEANLKLVMNSRPILADFYLEEADTFAGPARRADPGKVDVFLAMGASLVANAVQEVAPEIDAVCASLADCFSARAEANIYCSFEGVQAFPSHFDLHEVFVLQCEGEKVWNIYENRAADPVEALEGDDAQATLDAAKGRIAQQVRMRPGDRLYIPRGFYHDAIATGGASLHVTFSVAPLTARAVFALLAEEAVADPAFRAYLADARAGGGDVLGRQLRDLGGRLAQIVASPTLHARLAQRQRRLARPHHVFSLPQPRALHFYARTALPVRFVEESDGALAAEVRNRRVALGATADAAAWLLGRGGFAMEELATRFFELAPEDLERLVLELVSEGALVAYEPKLG